MVAVEVLLLVSGPGVAPAAGLMVALLVMTPLVALTFARNTMSGAVAPTARGPLRVQVMAPVAPAAGVVQDQPFGVMLTKVVEPGTLALSTRLPAAFGPSLVTLSV